MAQLAFASTHNALKWALCCLCRDYTIQPGHAIFLYGDIQELGNWQGRHAIQLHEVASPCWECDVTIPCTSFPFSYRFASASFSPLCIAMQHLSTIQTSSDRSDLLAHPSSRHCLQLLSRETFFFSRCVSCSHTLCVMQSLKRFQAPGPSRLT
jgi:hypothetical protein